MYGCLDRVSREEWKLLVTFQHQTVLVVTFLFRTCSLAQLWVPVEGHALPAVPTVTASHLLLPLFSGLPKIGSMVWSVLPEE